ncbi:hypothetical protein [Pseudomonas sp. CCOS 191]|uniref:hypothetical protein n=1 Tax=Pseudomonas sp. CCOS 191 TaxID=1649877 RepID=UPI00062B7B81|nr:hypothetical protein [Pseudomonas sp. CCOS 191]
MPFEKTYHVVAQHGVAFNIFEFTVKPSERCRLNELCFPNARRHNYQIVRKVMEVYDRMHAGAFSCFISVAISLPLNRIQGDALNAQRWTITGLVSAAVGSTVGVLAGGFISGGLAKTATAAFVASRLPTYHSGDVLVSISAKVKGGIGPQHTSTSMIVTA